MYRQLVAVAAGASEGGEGEDSEVAGAPAGGPGGADPAAVEAALVALLAARPGAGDALAAPLSVLQAAATTAGAGLGDALGRAAALGAPAHPPPPPGEGEEGGEPPDPAASPAALASGGAYPLPPAAFARALVALSRRLAYTTAAPPGWDAASGALPANGVRPPAPQHWQLVASGLRRVAASGVAVAGRGVTGDGGEAPGGAAAAAAAAAEQPPPPPQQAPAPAPAPAPAQTPPPRPLLPPGFDLVLNPEMEEVEEEWSSSEGEDGF
jgi:hypothetical protein